MKIQSVFRESALYFPILAILAPLLIFTIPSSARADLVDVQVLEISGGKVKLRVSGYHLGVSGGFEDEMNYVLAEPYVSCEKEHRAFTAEVKLQATDSGSYEYVVSIPQKAEAQNCAILYSRISYLSKSAAAGFTIPAGSSSGEESLGF